MYGGRQEASLRPGTENIPGAAGFGEAARLAQLELSETARREQELRGYLIRRLTSEIPGVFLNGSISSRLPGNVSICVPGCEASTLLFLLDQAGIAASGGSACSAGEEKPSHVLTAMGLSEAQARGCLRFSLGRGTTPDECRVLADTLKGIVARLRALTEETAR